MKRFLGVVLVLVVFSCQCGPARADDKSAQAVIDKAVKAMGGEEKLGKAEIATWKAKLKIFGNGGDVREGTTQITEGGNGRTRSEMERAVGNGEILKTLTVVNGDKAWQKQGETIKTLEQDAVLLMKRNREMFDAVSRPVILKNPRFLVQMAGEMMVGGKPAVVLDVIGTRGQDFKLFFDNESGLPVKLEARFTFPSGRESAMETTFANYKDFDGIKVATKREQRSNGVKGSESEITEFKVLEKVAPGTFDEPT
jgi:hypothetical protein